MPASPPPEVAAAPQRYEMVPWAEVRLHPQNVRRGDVPMIVESIRVNGWYGACGRQLSSGLLIWGNHRFLAGLDARELIARATSGAWVAHDDDEQALIDSWRSWPEREGWALETCPLFDIDCDDERALNILLIDNKTNDAADYDRPGLGALLQSIEKRRGDLIGTGFVRTELAQLLSDSRDGSPSARPDITTLAEKFLVPPFTVLDARQGYWQDRKREWLALGMQSELGRARNLLKMSDATAPGFYDEKRKAEAAAGRVLSTSEFLEEHYTGPRVTRPNGSMLPGSDSGNDPQFFYKKQRIEEELGRELTTQEFLDDYYEGPDAYWQGTSIFDPVLCELIYRWWSPEGARVLDPFAGGSVRGIVASRLGREYVGVDLRAEQVEANEAQRSAICRTSDPAPAWHVGDARDAQDLAPGDYDLVFSCPPYFDLERYSDDESDISNSGSWGDFCESLDLIVARSCAMLRPGRFACFVVGNVRGKDEALHDLQAATVGAFARAGLLLYNDAILVTALGSVPLRATRNFARRKLSRTHQAVLVFLKPPLDEALEVCGPIEVADPTAAFGDAVS